LREINKVPHTAGPDHKDPSKRVGSYRLTWDALVDTKSPMEDVRNIKGLVDAVAAYCGYEGTFEVMVQNPGPNAYPLDGPCILWRPEHVGIT
jgi:hypothetical protein